MITRRAFLDGVAGTAIASTAIASTARSYAQILGSNERLNFAVIGLNGRGQAHLSSLKANQSTARLAYICDVDAHVLAKAATETQSEFGYAPKTEGDFRRILDSKDVDAITIATPDHWHAPLAVLGLRASKHVYVEKPSSHNPREGELLVAAQRKYGKHVQVGDQQRSSDHSIRIIGQIHQGLIGRAYFGKAWYSNNRKSMGTGKVAPVPEWLNWELWQGPVPRSPYKDNIHPYNWHWLQRYGTGESLNNGTHEVDVCRWALQAEYPNRVTSSAGRYHFKDDWEFYDTMVTSFEYPDKLISWEGKCCNNMKYYGRDRGVLIQGTTGTVLLDRAGYEVYDLDGVKKDEFKTPEKISSHDLLSKDSMTDAHFANFIASIRTGEKLHSPIEVGNVSVTMLQLSNISWEVKRDLKIDTTTGHILNDNEAMTHWSRTYEKGWEVHV
ncbi:Gfo/Idh/MocA family oxidoreductase [Granulicella sp. WH15]|uniref:Gfo/Idh/MocA family protein n=1 Tax=Granulicella sp. WH15 TaxID=2602070 RepID=UPI00136715B1|nr:Gfo/Idh/MocA family oxidoreductase [Granulicella sp. WH15]QHN04191.1 Gfo/Idh/MocA family oxidoreductase [Granulicella sp. WH15]